MSADDGSQMAPSDSSRGGPRNLATVTLLTAASSSRVSFVAIIAAAFSGLLAGTGLSRSPQREPSTGTTLVARGL